MDDAPAPSPVRPRSTWWRRVSRLPVAMMLTSLLAALGIVQLSFQLGNAAFRTVTWTRQTQETNARIAVLETELQILQDARTALNTPEYLRQLARCQGFVGLDETVVVSPTAPAVPGENCQVVPLP
ncbi:MULTISPECIES: cell division protein FtsB [Deinococcus]|uniref:Cell division protein FtsB n=1 Tax=Deinococcus rufus TaxID=2136097 RepID=A0ABV7Z716_9DEIO|nr:cell division protein FtsB [Deinococcus sp. AB2017081]WQE96125.1 cell division protein FtsB [Deinococcus sp. AB2017081]